MVYIYIDLKKMEFGAHTALSGLCEKNGLKEREISGVISNGGVYNKNFVIVAKVDLIRFKRNRKVKPEIKKVQTTLF